MTETVEKAGCESCGADVRENTLYCYNCGSKLAAAVPVIETNGAVVVADGRSKAALDELSEKFAHVESEGEKLAKAATVRKKARVSHRKRLEYKWEPREDSPVLHLIFALTVFVFALVIVVLLAVWR